MSSERSPNPPSFVEPEQLPASLPDEEEQRFAAAVFSKLVENALTTHSAAVDTDDGESELQLQAQVADTAWNITVFASENPTQTSEDDHSCEISIAKSGWPPQPAEREYRYFIKQSAPEGVYRTVGLPCDSRNLSMRPRSTADPAEALPVNPYSQETSALEDMAAQVVGLDELYNLALLLEHARPPEAYRP